MKRRTKRLQRDQLRIEPLESRKLMAAMPEISIRFSESAKTLRIAGTSRADIIAVTQNDAARQLTVNSITSSGDVVERTFPAELVERVFVDLGRGDDFFSLRTIGQVRIDKLLNVQLGEGSDTVEFDWASADTTARANLTALVIGSDGGDAVRLNVGHVDSNRSVTIDAYLGAGDDRFVSNVINPEQTRSRMNVNAYGGQGDDEFVFNSTGHLGQRAMSSIRLDGGGGQDSFEVGNSGIVDGAMDIRLDGGSDRDTLVAAPSQSVSKGNYSFQSRSIEQQQPTADAQLNQILADVATKYGIPGLSASVITGDRLLTGVAGVRVAGNVAIVKVDDRFGVGSVTKAMTATLAGILIQRGQLNWDSTIEQLFPELKSTIRPEYLSVTIEQLLQHRGGVLADEDFSDSLTDKLVNYAGPAKQSRLALLPLVLSASQVSPIGTFHYSNAGYSVAAAMMERATGSNYERLMQRFVFDPLGMSSATFDPPVSNPNNPRQPIGHLSDGTPTPRDRPPTEFPTGALRPAGADLRMNVTDWSKFIRVHLGQAVGCHPLQTLPAPQTLARLHQAVPVSELGPSIGYAAGWLVASAEAVGLDPAMGTVLYHNGSDGVWYSEVLAFPRLGMSIQILANTAVDSYGNPLESTAFAEIKQRILARFMK